MSHEACCWLAAFAGFGGGFLLGMWAKDRYWSAKTESVTRACAMNGRLYRVTEEP